MSKKIYVFHTGGTIGSQVKDSVVDVADNTINALFSYYQEHRPNTDVIFDLRVLFNTLSENISFENWYQIYDAVMSVDHKNCDGIIITHGTDTLAYTSSFLAVVLNQIDIPILLVSSNLPLSDKSSNGYNNFLAAIDFISQTNVRGTYVPVTQYGLIEIHLGARLTQAQPFMHCFKSIGDVPFGEIREGIYYSNIQTYNPTIDEMRQTSPFHISSFPVSKEIAYIKPYPGINYDLFSFTKKPSAVLHELYHSGTACTTPKNSKCSVVEFSRKCICEGIDFYVAPFDSRLNLYNTAKEMQDAGIQFIYNMSVEAAYTKLKIAYGLFTQKNEIIEFLNQNIAFERLFK